ncbi:MAG TPA: DUF3109 family protein [Melioribacteraceae bacterium]|nr:DUF3109 family protein [Melioribacteraceae bacterium]
MRVISGYFIDPIIFEYKFVKSCNVSKCYGECCYNGVYADTVEVEKIISVKDKLIEIMDDSQTKDYNLWFEDDRIIDNDFESGFSQGTNTYNNKCVFLDQIGYCSLQKLSIKENLDKWYFKPKYCILYPLTFVNKTISVDTENLECHYNCNNFSSERINIIKTCSEELAYFLGESGYEELLKYQNEYNEIKIMEKIF